MESVRYRCRSSSCHPDVPRAIFRWTLLLHSGRQRDYRPCDTATGFRVGFSPRLFRHVASRGPSMPLQGSFPQDGARCDEPHTGHQILAVRCLHQLRLLS